MGQTKTMKITQDQVSTKCPSCKRETDKFIYMSGLKIAGDCSECIKRRGFKPMGRPHEFTTEKIREDRKKFKKDLYQPWREGEISKEFLDTYPDKAKEMVKEGIITKKQHDSAKEVWKDVV